MSDGDDLGRLLLLWPMDNLGYSSDATDESTLILIPPISMQSKGPS